MPYVVLGAQFVLVGVFVLALVGKVRSAAAYAGFLGSVEAFVEAFGVSRGMARPVGAAVVAGEVAAVGLLVTPWTRAAGFAVAAGLLAVLCVGVARVLRRGGRAPCRCFGASDTPVGRSHLVRNAVLLAVAAAGLLPTTGGDPAPLAVALVAVAGLVIVLIVRHLDDLVEVIAPRNEVAP